ncbi:hypothetical protein EBV26_01690 [bacterium]|nr:hypothetical protein [bacterium]
MFRNLLLACFCIIAIYDCVNAQEEKLPFSIPGPNELSLIKMKGETGETYVGSIVERDQRELIILTDAGTKITVLLSNIQDIRSIPKYQIHDGKYWNPNPDHSRYYFSPSAFNLKKGERYYQNTYLFLHSFNFGLSDNVSIGLGFEFPISFFAAGLGDSWTYQMYYVNPKYSKQVAENITVGVGVLVGNLGIFKKIGTIGDFREFGVSYGLVTYGNPEHNATLGLGLGLFDGKLRSDPVITISGMTRVTRRISLVTDNWFFPADVYRGIISYGKVLMYHVM